MLSFQVRLSDLSQPCTRRGGQLVSGRNWVSPFAPIHLAIRGECCAGGRGRPPRPDPKGDAYLNRGMVCTVRSTSSARFARRCAQQPPGADSREASPPAHDGYVGLMGAPDAGTPSAGGAADPWPPCCVVVSWTTTGWRTWLTGVPMSPSGWTDLAEVRRIDRRWLRQQHTRRSA